MKSKFNDLYEKILKIPCIDALTLYGSVFPWTELMASGMRAEESSYEGVIK